MIQRLILINIHHVDLALKYASRVIGIREGEIVYDGPASDVNKEVLSLIYKGNVDADGNVRIEEEK